MKFKNDNKKGSKLVGVIEEPITTSVMDMENKDEFNAIVDTGSPKSLVKLNKINNYNNINNYVSLYSVDGRPLKIFGTKNLIVKIGGKSIVAEFYVVENLCCDALIGRDILCSQNLAIQTINKKLKDLSCNLIIENDHWTCMDCNINNV